MAPCPRWKTTRWLYRTRKNHATRPLLLCTAPQHHGQFPRRMSHGESLSSLLLFFMRSRESAAFGQHLTVLLPRLRCIRHRSSLASIKRARSPVTSDTFGMHWARPLSQSVRSYVISFNAALHERLVLYAVFSIITRICKFKDGKIRTFVLCSHRRFIEFTRRFIYLVQNVVLI